MMHRFFDRIMIGTVMVNRGIRPELQHHRPVWQSVSTQDILVIRRRQFRMTLSRVQTPMGYDGYLDHHISIEDILGEQRYVYDTRHTVEPDRLHYIRYRV